MINNWYVQYFLAVALVFTLSFGGYHWFYGTTVKPHTTAEFAELSAMITRPDGRSGGSGVVISSRRNESKILTNGHVCHILTNGGLVKSGHKTAMVKYFQLSNVHDLCLVTVNANFRVNTKLADAEPEAFDEAIVSGFPYLLPNIITKGHFSNKLSISVLTGIRPCTPAEFSDPLVGAFCLILGGMPIIKNYESVVISATIQPGSSGSGVFNSKGELSGLVFAGAGDFAYGMIVPYEYVANFFDVELVDLTKIYPTETMEADSSSSSKFWKDVCYKNHNNTKIQDVCELANRNLLVD